jgi:PEP-CTERM motif
MTRRLITKCMPALALAGAILLSLPPRADADLQAAASIDAGPLILACDQNVCAGGAIPTILDVDPLVGSLATIPFVSGDISVSFAVQTSVKSPGAGGLNTLSSGGTFVQNNGIVNHDIQLTISDTSFNGPASVFTATGSGTWVDQTLPAAYGGSTITMEWFNDPLNAQGAESVGDTPGFLVFSDTDTPADGTNNQSFSFNFAGALVNPDPGLFSMTLDNEFTLGPGIRLESRGQALAKPQLAVPAPATLLLLGSALVLLGWRRRGSAA